MSELGISESEQRWFDRRAGEVRDLQATMRRKNVECVAKIGEILSECRERLANHKNGTFIRWCEDEFGITATAAYRAIQVSNLEIYHPNLGQYIELSAAYAITEKSCPEAAKAEVIKLAERGKIVNHTLAKRIIEKHKPQAEQPAPSAYRQEAKGPERATVKDCLPVENHVADSREMVPPGELSGNPGQLPVVKDCLTTQIIEAECHEETVTTEVDALNAMRAAWGKIKALPEDSAVKKACLARASEIVEMLSTGELIEEEPQLPEPVKITAAEVEEIYQAYPRKVGKKAAESAIRAAVNRGATPEYLLESTMEYARSRVGKEQTFTPHPQTWYQQGRYDDDRSEWWRDEGEGRGRIEKKSGTELLMERMEREGML